MVTAECRSVNVPVLQMQVAMLACLLLCVHMVIVHDMVRIKKRKKNVDTAPWAYFLLWLLLFCFQDAVGGVKPCLGEEGSTWGDHGRSARPSVCSEVDMLVEPNGSSEDAAQARD